jgi:hypothetical protein
MTQSLILNSRVNPQFAALQFPSQSSIPKSILNPQFWILNSQSLIISILNFQVKYFAEKVNPGLHDLAAKKQGLGAWKEEYIHSLHDKRHSELGEQHDEHVR